MGYSHVWTPLTKNMAASRGGHQQSEFPEVFKSSSYLVLSIIFVTYNFYSTTCTFEREI